jgi:chemotaxis protein MotB
MGRVDRDFGKGAVDKLSPEDLQRKVKEEIEKKLSDVKEQIMVDVFEDGVRIQLVDNEGKPMFALGGAEPSPSARKILNVLTETMKPLNNKIRIEGHTDAFSYASNRYTNWELSTERASSARRELEHCGLNPDRLARVSGYASTEPLIKDDPNDPRNRRISIILLYEKGLTDLLPDEEKGKQITLK